MLSEAVAELGGNWESSRMARLGGKFAGIALVTFEGKPPPDMSEALARLSERGLDVTAAEATSGQETRSADEDASLLDLELVGNDRPGILREISRVLSRHEINLEELGTTCESAPMAGGELFRMRALLATPANFKPAILEAELEALSAELMVEIRLADGREIREE